MTRIARVVLVLPLAAGCALAQPVAGANDSAGVDILHYDVAITPNVAGRTIAGVERVTFRARPGTRVVELNRGDLQIETVRLSETALAFEVVGTTVRITLPQGDASTQTLTIAYGGAPRRGITFRPDREQVYTSFSTSHWMPAVDAPSERATLTLRVRLPASWSAAGSGELVSRTPYEGDVVHAWRLRDPVPAFLFGFAAGAFDVVEERAGGTVLRFLGSGFAAGELSRIFRDTADMLAFFERRAGVPYRAKSYTQVLVAQSIGQELEQMAVLPEAYGRGVLKDERESWLSAHEIAHQWWGNLVTCRDWGHFWLNEGFATFMVAAHKEHRFGRAAYDREIALIEARYRRLSAAGKDRPLVFDDWTSPTADDRTIVYQKGAYVLHRLRLELGEELFWKAVRDYTRAFAGHSVTTADFKRAVERSAGRSLDAFFAEWVY